jgi:hypothetical protein
VNYSLLTADRATHLKIVAVALIAAILVVAVGGRAATTATGLDANGPVSLNGESGVDRSTIHDR